MKRYTKYRIRSTDPFNANDFPKAQVELEDILKATHTISGNNKHEILLAWMKDHALNRQIADSNPELANLLSGGQLQTENIESLFESGKENRKFIEGLEKWLTIN